MSRLHIGQLGYIGHGAYEGIAFGRSTGQQPNDADNSVKMAKNSAKSRQIAVAARLRMPPLPATIFAPPRPRRWFLPISDRAAARRRPKAFRARGGRRSTERRSYGERRGPRGGSANPHHGAEVAAKRSHTAAFRRRANHLSQNCVFGTKTLAILSREMMFQLTVDELTDLA